MQDKSREDEVRGFSQTLIGAEPFVKIGTSLAALGTSVSGALTASKDLVSRGVAAATRAAGRKPAIDPHTPISHPRKPDTNLPIEKPRGLRRRAR